MTDGQVRYALIVWEALNILRDAPAAMQSRQVTAAVGERIQPTAYEDELHRSGGNRWETALHFHSGDAATVGWMTKRGGWTITEAGIEALDAYPTPDELLAELNRRYREIDQRRKQAQQNLGGVEQFIATTLRLVEAGTWTAHEDLADLAGTTAAEVAHFLASGQVASPNAYRVLNADGSIPDDGMLHWTYRIADLHNRLAAEGVEFDTEGRAAQKQRLTADSLKELLADRANAEELETPAAVKRAWMVRGSNVDGYNLVPDWLRDGFVSVSASQLGFTPVTPDFAERLLTDQAELVKIADLLWERKQIILYGPPGTGKTYLARELARHLTDDGAVKLVQFHPSYTYEDFFEGFRPEPGGSGTLTFTLRAGPFRDFAEVAADNPTTAYILIIDEINRANLAKVFGELYFLLEYRDESISLQYSPDKEFTLPQNLFIIGTMNTADRSIARIDTAMRRRFAFVELNPRIPPVQGLLSRWLDKRGLSPAAALLLDELNRRIADSDAAIGPSYLMDERIYQREDGLDRVWQYSIMPLLEDLFYGQRDLGELYGLTSLRKAIAADPAES